MRKYLYITIFILLMIVSVLNGCNHKSDVSLHRDSIMDTTEIAETSAETPSNDVYYVTQNGITYAVGGSEPIFTGRWFEKSINGNKC